MKTNYLFLSVRFLILLILIVSCNRAGNLWDNAKITHTKEGYLSVIIKHAGSAYADSAFLAIKKILDLQNDIENAINYFESVKDSLPKGRFTDSISLNLKQLYEKRPLFMVLKDGKVGYINKKGEIIIQPRYTSGFNFSSNTTLIQMDSLWGFIDKTGQILLKPQYLELCGFSEGLAAVKQGEKWGFIDTTGSFVIQAKYSDAWPFSDSLALVELDNKWGFIDKKGKTVIDFTYDGGYNNANVSLELLINDTVGLIFLEDFGLTIIPEGARYAYTDFNGVPIYKKRYEWLKLSQSFSPYGNFSSYGYTDKKEPGSVTFSDINCIDAFSNNLAPNYTDGKWGFIDKTGKSYISPLYSKCSRFIENLAIIEHDDGIGFISRAGKVVIRPVYSAARSFAEDVAPVQKNEKWGYIDTLGNMVIQPKFDEGYNFSEEVALIKLKNKFGYINKTGDVIIEPRFVDANTFNDSLAAVKIDKKWGFIDKTGRQVIEAQYDEVRNFKNGLSQVKLNKEIGYIDKMGNVVWKPGR